MPDPHDELPLTPATLLILLSLAGGEKHGYAIMRDVEALTEGRTRLGPGTLYGAIKRLLEAALIAETDERPDPALDDERRRYYTLTAWGRRVLDAELNRMQSLIAVARARRTQEGGLW